MTRPLLSILLPAFLAVGPVLAGNAADNQGADLQRRLDKLAARIRGAPRLQAAASAFARAQGLKRDHLPILEAYMRKCVALERPRIALIPAGMILRIDPDNADALGLMAFDRAASGDYVEALDYAFRAVLADRHDVADLQNAGQLLAWYDQQPFPPRLENDVLRRIGRVRRLLDNSPVMRQAYERVSALYARQEEINKGLAEKLTEQQQRFLQINEQVMAIDARMREVSHRIEQNRRRIRILRTEYWFARHHPTKLSKHFYPHLAGGLYVGHGGTVHRGSGGLHTPSVIISDGGFVSSLRAKRLRLGLIGESIGDARAEIDALQSRHQMLETQGRTLLPEWRRLRNKIGDLREIIDRKDEAVRRRLAWQPPQIDRKAHEPVEGPEVQPAEAEKTPEDRAAAQLKLARLYAVNGLIESARRYAQSVVDKYPDTPSAPEAARLLGSLEQIDQE